MARKSVCNECVHNGICVRQEVTQSAEKELNALYHSIKVKDGIVERAGYLMKDSYDLQNAGIEFVTTCNRKLHKDRIRDNE